jgi:hypothetical protein
MTGAEVTIREIYDKVQEISTKMDVLATRFHAGEQKAEDHESRIRALERRVWVATGSSAMLAWGVVHVIQVIVGG